MENHLSIIIPFYNAAATIERTLLSLSLISVPNRNAVTVIGIDDGSTDQSAQIFEGAMRRIAGINHKLIRKQNGGSGSARNEGMKSFPGGWVFFLDADDELQFDPVPFITGVTGYSSLAFTVRFYKNDKPRGRLRPVLVTLKNHLDILTARNPFQPSNLIFRRDHLDSLFDPLVVYLEDWLFWFRNPRIFERMKVFRNVTSAKIHAHGSNKTSDRVRNGTYRVAVAKKFLVELGDILTLKQRHNLIIQSRIGLIQQGRRIPAGTFLQIPCNAVLYLKLIVYFILGDYFAKIDLYGK